MREQLAVWIVSGVISALAHRPKVEIRDLRQRGGFSLEPELIQNGAQVIRGKWPIFVRCISSEWRSGFAQIVVVLLELRIVGRRTLFRHYSKFQFVTASVFRCTF